jgi:hypothetical protein
MSNFLCTRVTITTNTAVSSLRHTLTYSYIHHTTPHHTIHENETTSLLYYSDLFYSPTTLLLHTPTLAHSLYYPTTPHSHTRSLTHSFYSTLLHSLYTHSTLPLLYSTLNPSLTHSLTSCWRSQPRLLRTRRTAGEPRRRRISTRAASFFFSTVT